MLPEEILLKLFNDEEVMQYPLSVQSTIMHSMERIIDECGYKLIKSDMDKQISE